MISPDLIYRFTEVANAPTPDLAPAALLIARLEYPRLDASVYLTKLDQLGEAAAERIAALGFRSACIRGRLRSMTHTFTHFRLEIQPLLLVTGGTFEHVAEADDLCWYSGEDSIRIGLPAPVSRLLKTLRSNKL